MPESKSLDAWLGGYDAIAAVSENWQAGLMADQQLGCFWGPSIADGVSSCHTPEL